MSEKKVPSRHDLFLHRQDNSNVPRRNIVIDTVNRLDISPNRFKSTELTLQPSSRSLARKTSMYGRKGTVRLEFRSPEAFDGLYTIRYSPDGNTLCAGYGTGSLQVRNAESGDLIATVRGPMEYKFPIMCIRFHPKLVNTFFAVGACGNIFLCTTSAGDYKVFAEEKHNEINTVDVNLTATCVVTGGKDASVRLYDINTGKLKSKFAKSDRDDPRDSKNEFLHSNRIFAIKFHPIENDTFFSGGWDDCIKIWDTRVREGCIKNIHGPHICGDSIDIRDKIILTGSWTVNNSLQTWDMNSGNLIDTITPVNRPQTIDGEFLYCTQYFDGDNMGDTVVTGGSGTGVVEVISIKHKKIICYFKIHKTIQAIDSYGTNIAFGGMESLLRIAEYSGNDTADISTQKESLFELY